MLSFKRFFYILKWKQSETALLHRRCIIVVLQPALALALQYVLLLCTSSSGQLNISFYLDYIWVYFSEGARWKWHSVCLYSESLYLEKISYDCSYMFLMKAGCLTSALNKINSVIDAMALGFRGWGNFLTEILIQKIKFSARINLNMPI